MGKGVCAKRRAGAWNDQHKAFQSCFVRKMDMALRL